MIRHVITIKKGCAAMTVKKVLIFFGFVYNFVRQYTQILNVINLYSIN